MQACVRFGPVWASGSVRCWAGRVGLSAGLVGLQQADGKDGFGLVRWEGLGGFGRGV